MKKEYLILATLLGTLLALFATTLLFDLQWVQRFAVRQALVYLLMAVQLFVGYKNIKELSK